MWKILICTNPFRSTWITSNELPFSYQPLRHNIEWPDWATHEADNLRTYFTDRFLTTGMDLGVALWQKELCLICTFFCVLGFDFIRSTLSQSSSPFLTIQSLRRASAHCCNDVYPRRRHQVIIVISDGSYKGLILRRWCQAPKNSEESMRLKFSSVLKGCCVLHRPLTVFCKHQYYLKWKV